MADIPESKVITLRTPVTIGDQVYDTLELREPTAGEFEKMAKLASANAAGAMLQLIADVSGIALPIIKKIGVRDMNEAGEYLMGFIQAAPQTRTSSLQD